MIYELLSELSPKMVSVLVIEVQRSFSFLQIESTFISVPSKLSYGVTMSKNCFWKNSHGLLASMEYDAPNAWNACIQVFIASIGEFNSNNEFSTLTKDLSIWKILGPHIMTKGCRQFIPTADNLFFRSFIFESISVELWKKN